MIKLTKEAFNGLLRGVKITFKVNIFFTIPLTCSVDDYLISVGDITESINKGEYSLSNTTITLANKDYYFSKLFANPIELPDRKLVEVFIALAGSEILFFKGQVSKWTLTDTELTLEVTA